MKEVGPVGTLWRRGAMNRLFFVGVVFAGALVVSAGILLLAGLSALWGVVF